ncbi:MAG: transporter substrate-binding domain-containing protein [Burkholderiales bacterium]|nr:MAG: transporter substrate-binding domain-containing protein [Burkholderiales bacterium]
MAAALCATAAPLSLAQRPDEGEPSEFEVIQRRGSLIVAVYKDNEPYSYGPPGEMRGLDIDIARALTREMGLGLSLLPFQAAEDMHGDLRNMVTRGHYLGYGPADLLMRAPVDMHLMMANRLALIFGTYQKEVPALLRDSRRIERADVPDDLKGQVLAGERGMGLTSALMGYGGGLLKEQVRLFDTGLLAAEAVVKGEAAAAYVTRAQAEYVLARQGTVPDHLVIDELKLGNLVDRGWPVGVAVKSRNRELRLLVEESFKRLHASGEMLSIFRKNKLTLTTA